MSVTCTATVPLSREECIIMYSNSNHLEHLLLIGYSDRFLYVWRLLDKSVLKITLAPFFYLYSVLLNKTMCIISLPSVQSKACDLVWCTVTPFLFKKSFTPSTLWVVLFILGATFSSNGQTSWSFVFQHTVNKKLITYNRKKKKKPFQTW